MIPPSGTHLCSDEMLWMAGQRLDLLLTTQNTGPTTVCIPPQPINRCWCWSVVRPSVTGWLLHFCFEVRLCFIAYIFHRLCVCVFRSGGWRDLQSQWKSGHNPETSLHHRSRLFQRKPFLTLINCHCPGPVSSYISVLLIYRRKYVWTVT